MALYKRQSGGAWWVRFQSGGKTVRRSTGTSVRELAEEIEANLRTRYIRRAKLGESVKTWKEAVANYRKQSSWRASTKVRNDYALTFFVHIENLPLVDINTEACRAARAYVERTQSPASANRIMAVFKAVLRSAYKDEWIKVIPYVPMATIQQTEITPLTPEQCSRLAAELPPHLRAPMLFSVLTGMRASNVRDLDWSRVDLENGHVTVRASQYKTNRDQRFPLSAAAVALLSSLPNRSGRVFLYDGNPISGKFNTAAFRKARRRAGLDRVRWHDLRHTFASLLASAGASDRVLQALGGWSSPRMVTRYAHLKPSDMRPHADAVGTILDTALTISASKKEDESAIKQVVPGRGIEPPTHALRMQGATRRRYTKR